MADITYDAVAGTWQDDAKWIGGVEPTAADRALLNASSANVTADAAAVCRALDATGYVATLAHNASVTLTIGDGTAPTGNVALKLVPGMGYTVGSSATSQIRFYSSSATQLTIDSGGKTLGPLLFSNFSANSNYIFASDITCAVAQHQGGTLNTGGFIWTCNSFSFSGGTAKTLTLGASIVNLMATSGTIWSASAASSTLNANTSEIKVNSISASDRTFTGGSKTYNKLTYTIAGSTGKLIVTGANTFAQINFSDVTNARILEFQSAVTQTIPAAGFNVVGTSGKLMTVQASTGGSAATIALTGGNVSTDYLNIKDITVTGGILYAGTHSTDGGGNNANVVFSAPPIIKGGTLAMMGA